MRVCKQQKITDADFLALIILDVTTEYIEIIYIVNSI